MLVKKLSVALHEIRPTGLQGKQRAHEYARSENVVGASGEKRRWAFRTLWQ